MNDAVLHATAAAEPVVLTLEEVHRRHGTLLLRWTSRLVGPRADVEDALQEVLVQIHHSLPAFRGEARLTTWLYQLTRRVVIRWQRRQKLRQIFLGAPEAAVDLLEQAQSSRALYRALDTLSEKHRTALILFEMEQLPAEEIARIMNTKPGTVWVWLHRARSRMRELLETEVRP